MKNSAAKKMKQVPEGYLIIGIDPHKKRHAAVAITQDFTVHDRYKFDNTREGLERIPQGVYAELRTAHNAYRRLVKERTRITNLMKGLLDGLFPEFVHVFKDPCGLTAASVLSTCAIPSVIAAMSEEDFVALIKATKHPQLRRNKLSAIHDVAKTSIGIKAGARSLAFEISLLVDKIDLIKRQVAVIQKMLKVLVDEAEEGKYLLSIRGLNHISVGGLLAELGCFKAYRSSKQMIKMAGSNPTESESGGKKKSRTPMSKQGRPVLIYCAWTA